MPRATSEDALPADQDWPKASALSIAIVLALWLLLGVVPSRLITFLSDRGVAPALRDALTAGLFTLLFVAICWMLRVLQHRGRI